MERSIAAWTAPATRLLVGVAVVLALATTAQAVPHPSLVLVSEPDYIAAKAKIEAMDFAGALERLTELKKHYPAEAEVYSLTGFSLRKLRRYDEALSEYRKALSLDRDHLGANEYLGELYAETGKIALAEEQLRLVRNLCPAGCEEADDLAQAIAKARQPTRP